MEKKYVLKVVRSDMTTRNGFKWGGVGETTVALDWDPTPECGSGLHGWLNGVGDIRCQSISESDDALWLALEVEGEVVDLGGKVKFEKAKTLYVGTMSEAATVVADLAGEQGPVIGITRSGGDGSTILGGYSSKVSGGSDSVVSGGDYSVVSGGDGSIVSGGHWSTVSGGSHSTASGRSHSTVSGGHWSMVSGGEGSTVSGGEGSTVSGGDRSTVSGGDWSTVSGGDWSTVSGGHESTVSGGDWSTVSGGDWSTVSGREGSTVSGGPGSVLQLAYWDGRKRLVIAYVGEDGIKPNTPYRLNNDHQFEEVVTSEK